MSSLVPFDPGLRWPTLYVNRPYHRRRRHFSELQANDPSPEIRKDMIEVRPIFAGVGSMDLNAIFNLWVCIAYPHGIVRNHYLIQSMRGIVYDAHLVHVDTERTEFKALEIAAFLNKQLEPMRGWIAQIGHSRDQQVLNTVLEGPRYLNKRTSQSWDLPPPTFT